jgi:hypothetical protein
MCPLNNVFQSFKNGYLIAKAATQSVKQYRANSSQYVAYDSKACKLAKTNGTSTVLLDKGIEHQWQIFVLLMLDAANNNETGLILRSMGLGSFRRIGLAYHSHGELETCEASLFQSP